MDLRLFLCSLEKTKHLFPSGLVVAWLQVKLNYCYAYFLTLLWPPHHKIKCLITEKYNKLQKI